MRKLQSSLLAFALLLASIAISKAQAGVFDLPYFVPEGEWSLGLEPEIALSGGTGAGLNLKPRYGVNNFLSWEGLVGVGAGSRGFRLGAVADLDWFPDYESQPGIATPFFLEYNRISGDGVITIGIKPMVYKTFKGEEAEYTPFLAVPMGWNIRNSDARTFLALAIGSMFKVPDLNHWRFTIEAGFNIRNSYSYLSGGVTYYH